MQENKTVVRSLWRNMSKNPPATVVLLGALALTIVVGYVGGTAQIINSIVTGGMWALMAVGLALVFGVMNVPQFAHGESFMVGAYVSYFVFTPIHKGLENNPNAVLAFIAPLIAILAAAGAGFVLGLILEKTLFYPLRLKSKAGEWVMNAFLLTLGISFMMTNGTTLLLGANFRGVPRYWDAKPLKILGAPISMDRAMAFVIATVCIAALWFFLSRTRTGRAIRAVSQDEVGAQMMGISLNFVYPLTFGLATALAAIAGASLLFLFQAYPTVGLNPLYLAWYVVMMAGLGNVAGAIGGGFVVGILQTATQQFAGIVWSDVIPTVLMITVLLVVPSGIFGSEVKSISEQ
jgi:branched-chain amino acid transport system permease protein